MRDHQKFWVDLLGKLGPPTFAATLVGCLLSGKLEGVHFVLLGLGVTMIWVSHWYAHHGGD